MTVCLNYDIEMLRNLKTLSKYTGGGGGGGHRQRLETEHEQERGYCT